MNRMQTRLMAGAGVALFGAMALAEGFTVDWHTVDGGGGRSGGGGFELTGTIGQPDAGVLEGGGFELTGGSWFPVPPGDCDFDGITNLSEFEQFQACFTGPGAASGAGCACFDLDGDGDVDFRDFGRFQAAFNGHN